MRSWLHRGFFTLVGCCCCCCCCCDMDYGSRKYHIFYSWGSRMHVKAVNNVKSTLCFYYLVEIYTEIQYIDLAFLMIVRLQIFNRRALLKPPAYGIEFVRPQSLKGWIPILEGQCKILICLRVHCILHLNFPAQLGNTTGLAGKNYHGLSQRSPAQPRSISNVHHMNLCKKHQTLMDVGCG